MKARLKKKLKNNIFNNNKWSPKKIMHMFYSTYKACIKTIDNKNYGR